MPCSDPLLTQAELELAARYHANNRKAAEILCDPENEAQLLWALGREYAEWLKEHRAIDKLRGIKR